MSAKTCKLIVTGSFVRPPPGYSSIDSRCVGNRVASTHRCSGAKPLPARLSSRWPRLGQGIKGERRGAPAGHFSTYFTSAVGCSQHRPPRGRFTMPPNRAHEQHQEPILDVRRRKECNRLQSKRRPSRPGRLRGGWSLHPLTLSQSERCTDQKLYFAPRVKKRPTAPA